MKKLLYSALAVVFILAFSGPARAQVSGPCANCHTMHNSQDGNTMVAGGGAAQSNLLTNDCVGCHTGDNDATNTTPYVYSTSAPTFGGNTLAGGNFYWVENNGDAKGHNVFLANPDDALAAAPGSTNGCGSADDCHVSLSTAGGIWSYRQGCTKCHMMSAIYEIKGFHHADDSNTVVGTEYDDPDGFYRFLTSHTHEGVSGIEHPRWNYGATAASHNEYAGAVGDHTDPYACGLGVLGNTMTGYCTGCHGNFHLQGSSGAWVRHPSDAVIPNTGEYANAFGGTYDPNVPVARPSLSSVSATVTPGTDLVMCLSCHVAHGSPYDDMLRWDYDGMVAGGGGDDGTGCFKCHTEKDGI